MTQDQKEELCSEKDLKETSQKEENLCSEYPDCAVSRNHSKEAYKVHEDRVEFHLEAQPILLEPPLMASYIERQKIHLKRGL